MLSSETPGRRAAGNSAVPGYLELPRAAKLASSSWADYDNLGIPTQALSDPSPSLHLCHLPDLMLPCISLGTI